jgi:isoprenylcysteine carboxyl methyltransferase (ICMT) family protein YpbQ
MTFGMFAIAVLIVAVGVICASIILAILGTVFTLVMTILVTVFVYTLGFLGDMMIKIFPKAKITKQWIFKVY